jgi:hypothetical protein
LSTRKKQAVRKAARKMVSDAYYIGGDADRLNRIETDPPERKDASAQRARKSVYCVEASQAKCDCIERKRAIR